ncbi:hypothetical protein HYPSUDRAFT_204378 [Hypholoma sublateritium FD-334 SS-4]|uniref:Uncharacterized protein n=1 Tax=Hypholoma sublateritium (strain FD-334 SS-4) TaxID=945553 RepID=A0A0D2PHW5_HYPSF|nr:hypothetical protein HYPSUDRAFT_204378 [Hypholoma sublateritium FD-334 SS-4]
MAHASSSPPTPARPFLADAYYYDDTLRHDLNLARCPPLSQPPPTAAARTNPTTSHTVAFAEGAAPPADDSPLQPVWLPSSSNGSWMNHARVSMPTLSTTTQHSPAYALRHHLSTACRRDKASCITVLAALHATNAAAQPQSSSCSWHSSTRSFPPSPGMSLMTQHSRHTPRLPLISLATLPQPAGTRRPPLVSPQAASLPGSSHV